jgi:hypothetical protein
MSMWQHDLKWAKYEYDTNVVPTDAVIKKLGNFEVDTDNLIKSASGFAQVKWFDLLNDHNREMLMEDFQKEKNLYMAERKIWWERAIGLGKPAIDILNYIGVDRNIQSKDYPHLGGSNVCRQKMGQGIFMHFDTMGRTTEHSTDNNDNFKRLIVFLDDWQAGQMWMFGNSFFTHWRKGDVITFDWRNTPYGSANMSTAPMHVINITTYATSSVIDFVNNGTPETKYVKREGRYDKE